MPQWWLMITAHINCCWTHNTCSSIAKTHADALNNYWVSRQAGQQLPTGNDSVNTVQLLWACAKLYRPCLKLHAVHQTPVQVSKLGCIALAISFSGFHSGRRLTCCTDGTVMLTSSLLWVNWSLLVSGLLETVVKVSKPHHNSWTKP